MVKVTRGFSGYILSLVFKSTKVPFQMGMGPFKFGSEAKQEFYINSRIINYNRYRR